MKFIEKNPPRIFKPDKNKEVSISDCGEIFLESDEQITFVTKTGKNYDLTVKEWGFYATPSLNARLKNEGFKTALVKNSIGRYYIMLVEKEKIDAFEKYLRLEKEEIVEWLDERKQDNFRCPICKSINFDLEFIVTRKDIYAITEDRKSKPAKYRECSSCGIMMLEDSPEYEKIYTNGGHYNQEGDPLEYISKRFNKIINLPKGQSDNLERIDRIKSFLATQPTFDTTATKKILDIGSGMGVFLYQFLNESWEGTAIEPEPNACKHMHNVLKNVAVIQGFINDLPLNKKYDLITMNRVLEHIYDLFEILKLIREHLEENGILYIEVPDAASYYKDGPNNEAFGYGHYYVFSPESLLRLSSQVGFEFISLSRRVEPSTKFTLYGFFRLKDSKKN